MAERADWLYYRVYTADLAEIRALVQQVVAPAMDRITAERPGLRWFFLQYVDPLGVHLRLRLHTPPSSYAAYEAVFDEAFAVALDGFRENSVSTSGQLSRMVAKRLYEPEYEKFGGPDGVALAERLMQRGSEAALACSRPGVRALRTTVGAAHTDLLVRRLPADAQLSFLHQYAWYWSGRARSDTPWTQPLPVLEPSDPAAVGRARRLRTLVDEALDDPLVGPALTGYTTDFWHMVHTAGSPRRDFLTAFHHLHLMNNRLGIVPGEEVQIARLLWLERLIEGRGRTDAKEAA